MRPFKTTFLIAGVMGAMPAYAALPNFAEHPVHPEEIFKETPRPVDLSSYPGAKTFRTKLKEGAERGPNFAGHYTIVTYGCGTQCQDNWIIDAKTGKILDRFSSILSTKYQSDSLLIIINPPDPDLKRGYENDPNAPFWSAIQTTYNIWKDNKFSVIYKDKWVNLIESYTSSTTD